eukprot:scaffold10.g2425.t1
MDALRLGDRVLAVDAATAELRRGHWVLLRDGDATSPAHVAAVERVPCTGLYSPYTPGGYIVVDGVAASVMEMYIGAGQADRDPYWCEPWPSALALAEELLRRPELVAGRRVAELGCGLGLAGLAAAAAGAASVVLLDREPLACCCSLLNARLNGLPVGAGGGNGAGSGGAGSAALLAGAKCAEAHLPVEARALLEERRGAHAAASPSGDGSSSSGDGSSSGGGGSAAGTSSRVGGSGSGSSSNDTSSRQPGVVCAELFDWSEPVAAPLCDVLLVADCLYEAFSVQPVAAAAPRLLSAAPDARILLADPPNRARHNRECFLDILTEEAGAWGGGGGSFLVEECGEREVRVWEEGRQAWRPTPIAMLVLRRAAAGGTDTVGVKLRRRE